MAEDRIEEDRREERGAFPAYTANFPFARCAPQINNRGARHWTQISAHRGREHVGE